MVNAYELTQVFRDDQTRLVIPNLQITVIDALTNIASSFVTNPLMASSKFFPTKDEANTWGQVKPRIKDFIAGIIDSLTIGLGVTKIETAQEYTMPMSKGIGSTGEVIHLLGARNEIMNLEFTTDRYPGRLGYVLRSIIQKVLETTQIVYLIDDLFLATPCLIRKFKVYKEGNYRGAVMGEVELVSLSTGGNWVKDKLGSKDKVKSAANKFKSSVKTTLSTRPSVSRVGVGTLIIGSGLLASIAGFGG
jgi:hypothetical protein